MSLQDKVDEMVGRLEQLVPGEELPELAHQLRVASPVALELLADAHLRSPGFEAHRIAVIQLREIRALADKLRWLTARCNDEQLEPELRVALAGILRNLTLESELGQVHDSQAGALLEPTLLFHALFAGLRRWLPPVLRGAEAQADLDLLMLGFPDYLHPVLRRRFEALWGDFHRLRRSSGARLVPVAGTGSIDEPRLLRLLADVPADVEIPSPPAWSMPTWASSWSAGAPAQPRLAAGA